MRQHLIKCSSLCITLMAMLLASMNDAHADVFTLPTGQVSLSFVSVGDPGNVPDVNGHGTVNYAYRIAKHEITSAQYSEFLNAVANTDTFGLYDPDMLSGPFATSGIQRFGSPGNYTYSVTPGSENFPVNYVSWGDAARFVNWLHNGQPNGLQGAGTTETGAYELNGATTGLDYALVERTSGASYFIPTEDEWYKAAYYSGNGTNSDYWQYPTQHNVPPVNLLSAVGTNNANFYDPLNGFTEPINRLTPAGSFASTMSTYDTFDQGGNLFEWTEDAVGDNLRTIRGGSYGDELQWLMSSNKLLRSTLEQDDGIGFRIAAVIPEPGTLTLLTLLSIICVLGQPRIRLSRL